MSALKNLIVFAVALVLFSTLRELSADDSGTLDYDHISTEFLTKARSEPFNVNDLAGNWTLIARLSRNPSALISIYPDGSDSNGLKNQDGSLPTLVLNSGTPSGCSKPFGFQINSWGTKDDNVSSSKACGSKIEFDLDAYHGDGFSCPVGLATSKGVLGCKVLLHGKEIFTPASAFPFGFPLTTSCRLFPASTVHKRIGCLVQKSGNSGDNIYVGALLFELKY